MSRSDFSWAWVSAFSADAGPRYLQVVGFMEQAISDERLRPGDRLPPQRMLADKLGVDLTTVTRAYNEARRRNLLEARGAAGTFIAAPRVDLSQVIDLSMNIPPPPAGMDLDDLLRQGVSQVLIRSDVDLLMTYHLGGGSHADRTAGSLWLAPMLGTIDEERILVTPGAQSVLAALILSQTRPGDVILTEPLVYPGLLSAATQLERQVVAVDIDEHGMLPDAMVRLARKHKARLVYLNPTLQNPTTHTMPAARRREIADALVANNLMAIEDDPYWRFDADAPQPLAHHAPAHVFYLSTLAKCLLPGLRTAYVVMPEAMPQDDVLGALRSFVLMSTPLMTALTTQWIHDGTADALLNGIRTEAWARQELTHRVLGGVHSPTAGGLHVWHALPSHWKGADFVQRARAEGLNVISSDAFRVNRSHVQQAKAAHIRISLGRARSRFELVNACRRLTELAQRRQALDVVV